MTLIGGVAPGALSPSFQVLAARPAFRWLAASANLAGHGHNPLSPHPTQRTGGDGPKRRLLEEVVRRGGLQGRVTLLGAVPHERAREVLLQGQVRKLLFARCFLAQRSIESCVPACHCWLCKPALAGACQRVAHRGVLHGIQGGMLTRFLHTTHTPSGVCQRVAHRGVLHGHRGGGKRGAAGRLDARRRCARGAAQRAVSSMQSLTALHACACLAYAVTVPSPAHTHKHIHAIPQPTNCHKQVLPPDMLLLCEPSPEGLLASLEDALRRAAAGRDAHVQHQRVRLLAGQHLTNTGRLHAPPDLRARLPACVHTGIG